MLPMPMEVLIPTPEYSPKASSIRRRPDAVRYAPESSVILPTKAGSFLPATTFPKYCDLRS